MTVYTADEQRNLLLKGSVEKVRSQIGLFRILLTIIATIIMALILYTLTLDKLHSIALLKLIGASNSPVSGVGILTALGISLNSAAFSAEIYRGGILERNVPACSGCHSPNGAGIPAQYPRLAGQHADYTEAQLVAFRGGVRANGPMMVTIAGKLNDKEIKAVSDYIAGLR